MSGRIDVHSHILPNVDDGCPYVEDSIECVRRFEALGYSHIFCTPHVLPVMPNYRSNVVQDVRTLQKALDAAGVKIELVPGGEIGIDRIWPMLAELDPLEIPTYGNLRRHALVDFWGMTLPDTFEPGVRYLQKLGFTVTMAHPERVEAFQDAEWLWKEVSDMGVRFQGNLQCFSDPPGSPTRELVEKHARAGTYWLLGSDCHWPETLDERLNGLQTAIDLLGEEVVDQLTRVNPQQLMR